jgi:hypothetical protein
LRTERLILACALALALGPGAALADSTELGKIEVPVRDPWVPPEVRAKVTKLPPETSGKELQAQVDRKLRARFDAVAKDGRLTREQARAGGLGSIADRFDSIDTAGRGSVTYEEYRHFLLRERR